MKRSLLVLVFLALFLIYRPWFHSGAIIGGDWPYYFDEYLEELSFPGAWSIQWPYGLGGKQLPILSLKFYLQLPVFVLVNKLGLPWVLVQKIFWFWAFLGLSFFSSYYLTRSWIGVLIYTTNTWVLMAVGGGQMGVALAYSIAPLVLAEFMEAINFSLKKSASMKKFLVLGLTLAVQVILDLRMAAITVIGIAIYFLFAFGLFGSKEREKVFLGILASSLVILGLSAFWLLPIIITGSSGVEVLEKAYASVEAVKFFSFADFSSTISLLHPNWPENIFGKVYFMRPEFLLLPVLAFGSLLFLKISKFPNSRTPKKKISQLLAANYSIIFFALLGLFGAFLAKGSRPPFGRVYLWLFDHLPGMGMFRDPTKFYLLVALSYSVLIPFSIARVYERLSVTRNTRWTTRYLSRAFAFLVTVYWFFLIRPAWLGQLGGTFKVREVPTEYFVLKDFLYNQKEFFRTFWIPQKQRFAFFSHHHPAMESPELPPKEELMIKGVKYVIIPFDSEGEIFLEDRKYDPQPRSALEKKLDKISWLKKLGIADKIAVYETQIYQDHFFITNGGGASLSWRMIEPAKYSVQVKNANQPVDLIFSEAYDEGWRAKIREGEIFSREHRGLNSFTINRAGDFEVVVEYGPQKYVHLGMFIAFTTLIGSLFYLAWRSWLCLKQGGGKVEGR